MRRNVCNSLNSFATKYDRQMETSSRTPTQCAVPSCLSSHPRLPDRGFSQSIKKISILDWRMINWRISNVFKANAMTTKAVNDPCWTLVGITKNTASSLYSSIASFCSILRNRTNWLWRRLTTTSKHRPSRWKRPWRRCYRVLKRISRSSTTRRSIWSEGTEEKKQIHTRRSIVCFPAFLYHIHVWQIARKNPKPDKTPIAIQISRIWLFKSIWYSLLKVI